MKKFSRTKTGLLRLVLLILIVLGASWFFGQAKSEQEPTPTVVTYDPSLGYQPSALLASFPVPANSILIAAEQTENQVSYQIAGIKQAGENSYLQALQAAGFEVREETTPDTYVLQKNRETVRLILTDTTLTIAIIADPLQVAIQAMTLDEKIGQMLLTGFEGTIMTSELETLIHDFHVGGLIFFGHNIENKAQVQALTAAITETAAIPPFLSLDEEGGRVSRLPDDVPQFPSAQEIGAQNDIQVAIENGKQLGNVLQELGFNMDHAPVLDINSNPNNTVIGDRAFGTDAETVSQFGVATMQALSERQIIPTVKHFPGHGDTAIDSHFGLPIVTKSVSELEAFEFLPFQAAIAAGGDAIMVSHIILEQVDPDYPATLSPSVVTNILRTQLGFEGVVLSDDMNMGAITQNFTLAQASVQSILAGMDIILIGGNLSGIEEVVMAIKEAIANQTLSEARLDESVYRILKLKQKYELLPQND